jgi:hypothetical protein
MPRSITSSIAVLLAAGMLAGCASKVEECKKRNLEVEHRQIAACADDACKDKARKDRHDFDEACEAAK